MSSLESSIDWHAAVRTAIRAPSSHNSQPWRFRRTERGIVLLADFERCLAVVDPLERELYISCGAALEHLLLAVKAQGRGYSLELNDDPVDANIAEVTVTENLEQSDDDAILYAAVDERQTSRVAFELLPVPRGLKESLEHEARLRNTLCEAIEDRDAQNSLAALTMEADRIQSANPAFRDELANWLRSNVSTKTDGMQGTAVGLRNFSSYLAPFVVRTFDLGNQQAARDQQLIGASPLLCVMSTRTDQKRAWIQCGQALARVALRVAAAGYTLSYLNQAVEIPDSREKLRSLLAEPAYPQLILRIGRALRLPMSRRRSVSSVLDRGSS